MREATPVESSSCPRLREGDRQHRVAHRDTVAWAALALLLWPATGGCSSAHEAPVRGFSGPGVEVVVSALELPGVVDAIWDLEVADAGGAPVFQVRLSSTRYGDGAGSASYVGPCVAGEVNAVHVWLRGIYTVDAPPPADPGSFGGGPLSSETLDGSAPYVNPGRLTRGVPCVEDRDTRVTFDVAVMRPAGQGFFDVAVNFGDVFCSAKLDAGAELSGPDGPECERVRLLHDPDAGGARGDTLVLALACTGGPASSGATVLFMDDLVIDCGDKLITIDPDQGLGNRRSAMGWRGVTLDGPGELSDAIFQVAVYRGEELLAGLSKRYWNVAIGVVDLAGCGLRTRGSADDLADPVAIGPTPPYAVAHGAVYPYVRYEVDDLGACGSYPLTFVPGPPSWPGGVWTAYTPPEGGGVDFARRWAPELPSCGDGLHGGDETDVDCGGSCPPCGTGSLCAGPEDCLSGLCVASRCSAEPGGAPDACTLGEHDCHAQATCIAHPGGFSCVCDPGLVGDGRECVDVDECLADLDDCSPDEVCINTTPGYFCSSCPSGHHVVGGACEDVDECASGAHDCSEYATCANTVGSYGCVCDSGYEGDGLACDPTCVPACEHGTCVAPDVCQCEPGFGGPPCADCVAGCADGTPCQAHASCLGGNCLEGVCQTSCDDGYEPVAGACVDIDECLVHTCGDHGACANEPGGFRCLCDPGYIASGATCVAGNYGVLNGAVYAVLVHDGVLYIGGSFTQLQPSAGGPIVTRNQLAALDAASGALLDWDPNTFSTGPVKALAVAGQTLFVGGWFNDFGGEPRERLAAFDLSTGGLLPWSPSVSGFPTNRVDALASDGATVYVGGIFTTVDGNERRCAAAFSVSTGELTDWDPSISLPSGGGSYLYDPLNCVRAVAVAQDVVYLGGTFIAIGGETRYYTAAVTARGEVGDPGGELLPWNPPAWASGGTLNGLAPTRGLLATADDMVYVATLGHQTVSGTDANGSVHAYRGHVPTRDWRLLAAGSNVAVGTAGAYTMALDGGYLHVGGMFQGFASRGNFVTVDVASGQSSWLWGDDGSWRPGANQPVHALAVSDGVLFVGGEFTTFHQYTGDTSWPAGPASRIFAMDLSDGSAAWAHVPE